MSKFTIPQRKIVRNLVFQAICEQKTLKAISEHVKQNSGLEISEDEADRIKKSLRKEGKRWISALALSNYEYVAEYVERINSVKYSIERANELYNQPAPIRQVQKQITNTDGSIVTTVNETHTVDNSDVKRKLLSDIANMNRLLLELYSAVPIIHSISETIRQKLDSNAAVIDKDSWEYNHSHDKDGRPYKEGEIVFKEDSSPYKYHSSEYSEKQRLGILTEEEEREAKRNEETSLEEWKSMHGHGRVTLQDV